MKTLIVLSLIMRLAVAEVTAPPPAHNHDQDLDSVCYWGNALANLYAGWKDELRTEKISGVQNLYQRRDLSEKGQAVMHNLIGVLGEFRARYGTKEDPLTECTASVDDINAATLWLVPELAVKKGARK